MIAAIVLAAGQSKRMGAFKPLLPFGDTTVIESCIDFLQRGGVNSIVVVLGHQAQMIEEQLKSRPVTFVINPDPESEMADSIACGVSALPPTCEASLISPADYPAIPATVITSLIEQWRAGAAKLLLPVYDGHGGHPVLVDLSFREQLLNLDRKAGLKGLFDSYRGQVARVSVDSPFIARDIDTWEDYRALHLDVFGTEPPNTAEGP